MPGGFDRCAVCVNLPVVVEHQDSGSGLTGQSQFGGVSECVDAGRDHGGLGLGDDRLQLGYRRAGLQWYGHRAQPRQSHVDRGVVDAVEAQQADPVARFHRLFGAEHVGQCADAVPKLAVADGFEVGEQSQRGVAGAGVGHEFDRALSESRPIGVSGHDGLDDLG